MRVAFCILALIGLYLVSLYSYLLFHSLIEMFSVVIACGIFMLAWNSRRFMDNDYLLFVGIAYLFIGALDMVHTLAYKGMGVFQGFGANLPTQLWIAARYTESLSLLIAPLLLGRKLKPKFLIFGYTVAISLLLGTIFYWDIFPDCFVTGIGLTPFKKVSEYVISLILLASISLLLRKRKHLNRRVLHLLVASIIVTVASELAFTFYIDLYGLPNLVGHFLKLVSFYIIYQAIIRTGLVKPYNLLFRELSAANAKLSGVNRHKDVFLADMSHELRTPLTAILGISEVLQMEIHGSLNEEQLQALQRIEESGRHLLDLINDILDISKIEAGKLGLEMDTVSVESVCQDSLQFIKESAQKKRLRISTSFHSGLATFQADERRLKQILVNLLSNAVKFTPDGGTIGLEVVDDLEKETILFAVWDTGIGIPADQMKHLFQPFVQLDNSPSRQHKGTGLGLALTRRLAELHGGSISVESVVGKGSRFTISLPWRTVEKVELAGIDGKTAEKEKASDVTADKQLRAEQALILFADDNEDIINVVSEYLLTEGYRVISARDGQEAIQQVRNERPDLILMDIQMPNMDGLEAIRRIRDDTDLADIPIIALTALAMPGDRNRCLEAGADAHTSKPVSLGGLVEMIQVQLH